MTPTISREVRSKHDSDRKTKRRYINGILSVFHCHHYTAIYTQLAIDAGETPLLKECARASFRNILDSYFHRHSTLDDVEKRIEFGCEYFALLGLGHMRVVRLGEERGEVELLSSHVDSGWIKKWGRYDRPVNYVGAGFVEALFETVLDTPERRFVATETRSIAMGAPTSLFKVVRR